jgi:myo-inositol-1(or 4)-monophosphatase
LADKTFSAIDAAAARDLLVAAAYAAGRIALPYFKTGERTAAHVHYKGGGSPVTEADLAVDDFLKKKLSNAFAGAGWLSEETEDNAARLNHSRLLVVDPIDGTRGFVGGDPHWTVSIALVVAGRPVAGVVHAPALDETFAAAARCGAALNGRPIAVSEREQLDGARIGGPRAMIQDIQHGARLSLDLKPKIPSLAYRIALVAKGELDLAVASGKAHDWDIAAADLILAEAGGALVDAAGEALTYNREETLHPELFAASKRLIRPFVAAAALVKAGRDKATASGG